MIAGSNCVEGLSSVKAWGDSLSLFSHIIHHNFA
jgi:hypothetical protein